MTGVWSVFQFLHLPLGGARLACWSAFGCTFLTGKTFLACTQEMHGEGNGNHSSILAWRIQGQRSLVGYSPWGHKESDPTEETNINTMPRPPAPISQVVMTLSARQSTGQRLQCPPASSHSLTVHIQLVLGTGLTPHTLWLGTPDLRPHHSGPLGHPRLQPLSPLTHCVHSGQRDLLF